MGENPFLRAKTQLRPPKPKSRDGHEVSKLTKISGKRIAGALRAEFARAQKRQDSKPR
jgi:hypothetical protein